MPVLAYDDVMLREPALLLRQTAPVGPVKMDFRHPLARGCLAYFPLHECGNLTQRDAVSGMALTPVTGYEAPANHPFWGVRLGRPSLGLDAGGAVRYLTIAKQFVTDGCTLCMDLYKASAFDALASPFFYNNNTGINAGAYGAPTKLGLHWNGAYWNWGSGPTLTVGEWITCAITRQAGAGNTTIDVHVVSRSSGYATASPGTGAAVTFPSIAIGDDPSNVGRSFLGGMANARLYNRALSRMELQELFYNPYQMLIPA